MRRLPFASSLALALVSAAVACGGTSPSGLHASQEPNNPAPPPPPPTTDDDAGPQVDNGAPSTNYPAPHPPLPQLVNLAGGKVLTSPRVHLVFFPGYEHEAELEGLAQALGGSSYWSAATKEYGVGQVAYDGFTELTGETAPMTMTSTAIDTYMNGKIASGAFGTPDPSVIYTIVYPKTTSITMPSGPLGSGASCTSFGGYHSDTSVVVGTAAPQNYAYAVLPTCTSFGALDETQGLTGAASHEWIEAVTDPYPSTNQGADSAYAQVDTDHFIWLLFGGTESGDLCVPEVDAFFKPTDVPYTVQRTWSNALAKQSHDPCAPNIAGNAYFNSAPVLPDAVSLDLSNFGGGSVPTQGVQIAVGSQKTIEVDLFSDAATSGPWKVGAIDAIASFAKQPATLDFAWDRTSGLNGEKLHLTITVKSASTFLPGGHPFVIVSQLGGRQFEWPALVVEP